MARIVSVKPFFDRNKVCLGVRLESVEKAGCRFMITWLSLPLFVAQAGSVTAVISASCSKVSLFHSLFYAYAGCSRSLLMFAPMH